MALSAHRPRVILIAGPYRSGSGDIPLVSLNLGALEAHPLALWRAGHISRPRRSCTSSLRSARRLQARTPWNLRNN
jgi:hypothetical protein